MIVTLYTNVICHVPGQEKRQQGQTLFVQGELAAATSLAFFAKKLKLKRQIQITTVGLLLNVF